MSSLFHAHHTCCRFSLAFLFCLLLFSPIMAASTSTPSNSSSQNSSGPFDYFVVKYSTPPGTAQINQIQAAGYDIVGYSSGFRYIVRKNTSKNLIQVPKLPNATIERFSHASLAPPLVNFSGKKNITISFFDGENTNAISAKVLVIAPGATMGGAGMSANNMNQLQVQQLSNISGIQYIDENYPLERFDNRTNQILGANSVRDNLGYTGAGVVAAITDSGLDTGNLSTLRPDLWGRVIGIHGYCSSNPGGSDQYDDAGHGTAVAGILMGNGTVNASNKGACPSCQLFFQALDCAPNGGGSIPPWASLFRESSGYGAKVHSISLGSTHSYYDLSTFDIDNYTRNENKNL